MSRYKQSRKATNRDEMYKEVFDKKGVKNIVQFRAEKLKRIDEKIKQKIRFDRYTWKYGDSFSLLASRYYSDPKSWWVIAAFNNTPTESHLKLGDEVLIPLSISEALQVI
tara:strand:- start:24 stop:353 length:330 start_codon:yes stop_codon:yes gene_type:complete